MLQPSSPSFSCYLQHSRPFPLSLQPEFELLRTSTTQPKQCRQVLAQGLLVAWALIPPQLICQRSNDRRRMPGDHEIPGISGGPLSAPNNYRQLYSENEPPMPHSIRVRSPV